MEEGHVHNAEIERKEKVKQYFQFTFQELLCMGVTNNLAAAEALATCRDVSIERLQVAGSDLLTACGVQAMFKEAETTGTYTPIIRLIGRVLSSSLHVKNSFLLERSQLSHSGLNREGLTTAGSGLPIDLKKVDFVLERLCQCTHEGVCNSMVYALESLSNDIRFKANSMTEGAGLIPMAVVFEVPDIHNLKYLETMRNVISFLYAIPNAAKTKLQEYICNISEERYVKHISVLQEYITHRVDKGAYEEAKCAVAVLSVWYSCLSVHQSVPASRFYNEAINEKYASTRQGKRIEYTQWLSDLELTHGHIRTLAPPRPPPGSNLQRLPSAIFTVTVPIVYNKGHSKSIMGAVPIDTKEFVLQNAVVKIPLCCRHRYESLVSYPFVVSTGVKAAILELDAARQMREGRESEIQQAVATGSRYVIPYLVIRIRRSHIVEDAINQFAAQDDGSYDLKKPLKVVFDGEDGIDEGGVRKEFYQIVTKQLLDPGYGMFKYFEESRLLWFSSDSLESNEGFELIGTLVGVAIYNSVIIDLHMPSVIYKKLKGKDAVNLLDLHALQPSLAIGLQKLLDYKEESDGEIEAVFDMRFEISYEVFGEMKTVELMPGGSSVLVTAANREMYVELYVEYLLNKSIETQFTAFAKGFRKVCGGDALDLFEAAELELLICGNPVLDFAELEKGTVYDDGFDRSSRVIEDLWSVLHAFDETDKKKFLKFLTGSDRSPIEGLSKLRFVISRNGDEDTRLPSAHTCFNHMLLPEYSSREVLERNLCYAISEAGEGFALA